MAQARLRTLKAEQRLICGCLISLMVATGCAGPSAVVQKPVGVPDVREPLEVAPQKPMADGYVPGVENFGFVTAAVWRGAQPTPAGFRMLKAMGVKTVIDLQERDEHALIPEGVVYVHLPTSSWRPDRVDVAAVLAAIAHSPKPAFIHCHVGRDRTGLAVAAYRLSQGMKASDVVRELRNFHVDAWVQSAIERRIQSLAKQHELLGAATAAGQQGAQGF